MYMFFWFFKQLYYCLRRIFKSGLLLLILFFIAFLFIFIKPSFAATTLEGFDYNGSHYTFPEPVTINNNNNSYCILSYDNGTRFRIIEPYQQDGYLVTYTYPSNTELADINYYNIIRSVYQNNLSNSYGYDITYNNGSWGQWSTRDFTSVGLKWKEGYTSSAVPDDIITFSNVHLYVDTLPLFNNYILPNNIKLTDNICLIYKYNTIYLLYTTNSDAYFSFNNFSVVFSCKSLNTNTVPFTVYTYNNNTGVFNLTQSNITEFNTGISATTYYRYSTNKIEYNNNIYDIGYHDTFSYLYQAPFIINNSTSIENWDFDYLSINCGSFPITSTFYLDCDYEGYTFSYDDLRDYITIGNGVGIINIPKTLLNQSIVLRNGFNFSFALQARTTSGQVLYQDLGSYTLNLTTEQEQQLNEDSNKQLIDDINKNQKETTQAIENLENTITDTNIDDSSIDLPIDNSNDITQDGLNGIFTSIYNAFCVGQPQDIVFPIPFTNKSITLQPNYVRSMLNSVGATWVITIIEAFWWYLISRYIIKDITSKITKIKSGNIESIENTNIKGDML